MRSALREAILVLACLTVVCVLEVGGPVALATGSTDERVTGRLELTILSNGSNVSAQCTATAVDLSGEYAQMLTLSDSGVFIADLPVGTYVVMVMPAAGVGPGSVSVLPSGHINAAMPTMLTVKIVGGQIVKKEANVGGSGPDGSLSAGDLESLFHPASGDTPVGAGTDLDLNAVPSSDELVGLAQRYHDLYFNKLTLGERQLVESLTRRIETRPGITLQIADVEQVTTAAAAIAAPGASRAVSVVLAARAVMAMPDLALALNNFGAILRLLDELPDSLTVLIAAREADPQSPIILTNLADSVRDLGDSHQAEDLYLKALSTRDDFGPSLSALGDIYMARGDFDKALELMLRGAQMGFCAAKGDALDDALDELYGDSDAIPPLPQTQHSDSLFSSLASQRGTAPPVIPEFGKWDDIASLSGSVRELSRVMQKVYADYTTLSQQHDRLVRQLRASGPREPSSPSVFQLSFDKQLSHLKLIRSHFWRTAVHAVKDAQAQADTETSTQRYSAMVETYSQRMATATTPEQARKIAAEFCAEAAAFARQQFGKNKPIWAAMNTVVTQAIEDYWAFSQPVLDSIYDPTVYRLEEMSRRLTVYHMIKMGADCTFELASMPISHSECANCGGTGVVPTPLANPNVPSDDDKCPFKGGSKFSVALGPVDFKVDCTTLEVGFSAGAAGSVTWDFKNKRVTQLFVGVGAQTGAGPVKLGGKFGAQITFDSDGSVSDISGEASGSAGAGPLSTEASVNGGLVVGVPALQVPIVE